VSAPSSPTLRSAAELVAAGLLAPDQAAAAERAAEALPIAVPSALRALIDPGDPADPIARQFIPSAAELETTAEELADPIGDEARSPVKGIVHRYPDRVLLKPLLVCPVYCRFCFRRGQVGAGGGVLTETEMAAALAYIAARPEIWEVVLTGGDPLLLSPARLATLMARLAEIPHLAVIRIHSRIPVATPERITPELAAALCHGTARYLVLHCNHPRELTPEALAACRRLREAGWVLLAQTVLLKGVNADVETLEALLRRLVANGIQPYYLHHPDLVRGTAHFRPTVAEGRALVQALRGRLSGLCQPTYVLDIPGGHGKVPLDRAWYDDGAGIVHDATGAGHHYPR
jgi:lysine 2,3-aminomutase